MCIRDRARPAGSRQIKRLLYDPRDVRCVFYQKTVLGKRFRRAGDVRFLKYVAAQLVAGNLTGDGHQRHRIHIGGSQCGQKVQRTGTGGGDTHAGPPADPAIGRSRVSCVLLLPNENMADWAVGQAVVHRADRRARIAENCGHALLLQ